jgi:hypothetical protein
MKRDVLAGVVLWVNVDEAAALKPTGAGRVRSGRLRG